MSDAWRWRPKGGDWPILGMMFTLLGIFWVPLGLLGIPGFIVGWFIAERGEARE